MNFDFDDDQRSLQAVVRTVLEDQCTLADVRQVFEGPEPFDRALWDVGAEMGWMGLAVPEDLGGVGLGHLELALVAEEVGRALAPIPLASSVYLAIEALLLAGTPDQQARWIPGLASGELIGTYAVSERADRLGDDGIEATFSGGLLRGAKAPVPDGGVADLAVIAVDGGRGLVVAELEHPTVSRHQLDAFDPSRPMARLRFDGTPAERLGSAGDGAELRAALADRAAVLLAFEQVGGAERALGLAVEYAKERYTFGRAIGSYQSIKHKLAEVFVAVELARSNAYHGAWALSSGRDDLGIAACLARISATEAFQLAAREGLHVHGGIGFTWEHDAHLFLRRSTAQSLALGSARRWKHLLVDRLVARG